MGWGYRIGWCQGVRSRRSRLVGKGLVVFLCWRTSSFSSSSLSSSRTSISYSSTLASSLPSSSSSPTNFQLSFFTLCYNFILPFPSPSVLPPSPLLHRFPLPPPPPFSTPPPSPGSSAASRPGRAGTLAGLLNLPYMAAMVCSRARPGQATATHNPAGSRAQCPAAGHLYPRASTLPHPCHTLVSPMPYPCAYPATPPYLPYYILVTPLLRLRDSPAHSLPHPRASPAVLSLSTPNHCRLYELVLAFALDSPCGLPQ